MNEDVINLFTSLKDPSVSPSKTILSRLFGVKYAEETVKQSPNIYKNENLSIHELEMLLHKEELLVQAGV